jgi:hypothetical protein
MTHPFVKTFHDILSNKQISLTDKMLLAALRFHCGSNGHCWPSIPTLGKELQVDERTIRRTLKRLCKLGLVNVQTRLGNSNTYELITPDKLDTPPGDTFVTPDKSVGTSVSGVWVHPCPGTPDKNDTLKERKEKKEIIQRVRTPKSIMTKEQVETEINAVGSDLAKYHKKYPDTDVEGCFEDFSEHFLCKNDLKTGKPNWLLWTDWNKAFWNWLRKPWNRDRKVAKKSWRDA